MARGSVFATRSCWRRVSGHRAEVHRLNHLPIYVSPAFLDFDEHRAEAALPHVSKDAFGGERQVDLQAALLPDEDFWMQRRVHWRTRPSDRARGETHGQN